MQRPLNHWGKPSGVAFLLLALALGGIGFVAGSRFCDSWHRGFGRLRGDLGFHVSFEVREDAVIHFQEILGRNLRQRVAE